MRAEQRGRVPPDGAGAMVPLGTADSCGAVAGSDLAASGQAGRAADAVKYPTPSWASTVSKIMNIGNCGKCRNCVKTCSVLRMLIRTTLRYFSSEVHTTHCGD